MNEDKAGVLWGANIPPKVKILLWLVRNDKVLTKVNLLKKRMGRAQCLCFLWAGRRFNSFVFPVCGGKDIMAMALS